MVEMCNLLPKDEVFQQSWATLTSTQAILVFNWTANIAGQVLIRGIDGVRAQEIIGARGSSASLIMDPVSTGMAERTGSCHYCAQSSGKNE
jgi:hypothetical protein